MPQFGFGWTCCCLPMLEGKGIRNRRGLLPVGGRHHGAGFDRRSGGAGDAAVVSMAAVLCHQAGISRT